MIAQNKIIGGNEEKQVIFRMPASDIEAFDNVAKSRRMTRAGLLKQCVLETIKEGIEA